jgi:hypothetical protein
MVGAVVVVAALASASAASAATRYASPTGTNTIGNCTSPDPGDPTNPPCTLTRANGFAANGDALLIAPGDYDIGAANINVGNAVDVHGTDGQPLPRIISSASNFGVTVNDPGAQLRHVEIDYSGPFEALDAVQAQTIEQVVAHSSGSHGCILENDVSMRDSVCLDTAASGIATNVETITGTFTSNVRNLTAVATGTSSIGLTVRAPNAATSETLVAKNVIADGVGTDISAQAGSASSTAVATMANSNYSTRATPGTGTATVTDPATGGNQIATPLFSDAGLGLFHQAVGSPTIDAGAVDGLLGTLDFDGDARTLGAAPDIGADEFIPLPVISPPPTTAAPPPTALPTGQAFDLTAAIRHCKKKFRKGPKRKRCIKKARLRAGL